MKNDKKNLDNSQAIQVHQQNEQGQPVHNVARVLNIEDARRSAVAKQEQKYLRAVLDLAADFK